jgi:hypothetical protein
MLFSEAFGGRFVTILVPVVMGWGQVRTVLFAHFMKNGTKQ